TGSGTGTGTGSGTGTGTGSTTIASKLAGVNSKSSSRRKRQTQSNYGGIYGLPTTFGVTLPQSCCTTDLSSTDSLSNLYCISNANNSANSIHTNGCSKLLGKFAVGQTLGLAVINSFLVVLGLALIPVLMEMNSSNNNPQNAPFNQPMAQYNNQPYQYQANEYHPDVQYNNYVM
ncbi:unnamed protein product, partial [Adineta steineri]